MGTSGSKPKKSNVSKVSECQAITLKSEIKRNKTPRIPLDIYIELSKGICKLIIKNLNTNATGFFISDKYDNKFLITNNHVISENLVNSNVTIIMELHNKEKYELELDKNERYIKFYENPVDITVIQINDLYDLCDRIKFLSADFSYKNCGYNRYVNNDIYLLGYPCGNSIECSTGIITSISVNEFKHNCDIDTGSCGSPIILVSNYKVVGIHKVGIININIGSFLGIIFNYNDYIIADFNKEMIDNPIIKKAKSSSIQFQKAINSNELINSNKIVSKQNNSENYILSEISISKNEVNENIRIINSYEAEIRNSKIFTFDDNLRNENEIKDCKIFIEEKLIPFSYFYKFNKEGTYKIKYSFPNNLTNFYYLFYDCKNIISLDFTHFNTNEVTNIYGMFYKCSSLSKINLSNFNTENMTDMSCLFSHCSSLTNLDLSNFNTENVNEMESMFYKCSSLTNINLSSFNTKKVKNMRAMFYECSSLTDLNLSNFNTENVTDMRSMFYKCSSLNSLNLSNFNTKKVKNMYAMFQDCCSLTNLDLSNFNTQNVTEIEGIFHNCSLLNGSDIICYDKKVLDEFAKRTLDQSIILDI